MNEKTVITLKKDYICRVLIFNYMALLLCCFGFYSLIHSILFQEKTVTIASIITLSQPSHYILFLFICVSMVAFASSNLKNYFFIQKTSKPLLVMDTFGLHSTFKNVSTQIPWSSMESIGIYKDPNAIPNTLTLKGYTIDYLVITPKDTPCNKILIPFALYDSNNRASFRPVTTVSKLQMNNYLVHDFNKILTNNHITLLPSDGFLSLLL